ncbi:MAG: hypothetical protein SFZ23_12685 [Planctomycetota bacterium]|nr:hypothetical protein [Planctomycetota bacterium]
MRGPEPAKAEMMPTNLTQNMAKAPVEIPPEHVAAIAGAIAAFLGRSSDGAAFAITSVAPAGSGAFMTFSVPSAASALRWTPTRWRDSGRMRESWTQAAHRQPPRRDR